MSEPAVGVLAGAPNFVGDDAARTAFFGALVGFQKLMPKIAKGRTARVETAKGSYSYDYADLTDVSEVAMPLLTAAGFAWSCLPLWADSSRVVLRYMLAHSSGGVLWGDYPLNLGGTPQAAGSAITYARRYCLCAVTGLAPKGDDDDAAGAAGTAQRRAPAARPAAQRPARAATAPDEGPTAQRASERPAQWSPKQRSQIMAMFTDAGISDRDERLLITGAVVGRPLGSSNDLTYDDASKVIETLSAARTHEGGFSAWLAKLDFGKARAEPEPTQPSPTEGTT